MDRVGGRNGRYRCPLSSSTVGMLDVGIGVEDAASRMFPVVPRPAGDVIGRSGSLPPNDNFWLWLGSSPWLRGTSPEARSGHLLGARFGHVPNSDNSEQAPYDDAKTADCDLSAGPLMKEYAADGLDVNIEIDIRQARSFFETPAAMPRGDGTQLHSLQRRMGLRSTQAAP